MYKKLLDKGFEKIIYKKQEDNNAFYKRDFLNSELINKLFDYFNEDKFFHERTEGKIYCTLEITEDLSFAQYCFNEIKENDDDYREFIHNDLSLEEFNNVLDILDDMVIFED
jgi:hypothetical protein